VKLAARSGSPMRIEFAGRSAQAECEAAPSRDAALCKVSPLVQRIAFDAIARKPVAPQDRVILTGWAEPAVSGMAASLRALVRRAAGGRTFRVGTGTVQFVGPLIAVEGAMTATGPVFADPGDSGGAAYSQAGSRRIVGVTVCGGSGCFTGATEGTTAVTNLTDESGAVWVADWMRRTGAKVCGFAADAACQN